VAPQDHRSWLGLPTQHSVAFFTCRGALEEGRVAQRAPALHPPSPLPRRWTPLATLATCLGGACSRPIHSRQPAAAVATVLAPQRILLRQPAALGETPLQRAAAAVQTPLLRAAAAAQQTPLPPARQLTQLRRLQLRMWPGTWAVAG